MEKQEKEFLEHYILPRFDLPTSPGIVWGEQEGEYDRYLQWFSIGKATYIIGEDGLGGFSKDNPLSWFDYFDKPPGQSIPVKLKEKYQSEANKYVCELSKEEIKEALKTFLPEHQYYATLSNSGKVKYGIVPFSYSFVIVKQ